MNFIRAAGFIAIYRSVVQAYGLQQEQLKIPATVFEHPMTLIPISEFNFILKRIEQLTQDPDYILNRSRNVDLTALGSLAHWMFSGYDLASMIRRINSGITCLQSGAFVIGSQSGKIIKWVYQSSSIDSEVKVHDSIRVAMFMMKAMRVYLGEDFSPLRVMLSGARDNKPLYRDYFGCDIGWNHNQTEVWFDSDLRFLPAQRESNYKKPMAIDFKDLDDFLSMPQFDDEMKVVYEMIIYSCHYGLPSLERVSSLIGLSNQQFQRKLNKRGYNFSSLCGFVLSNEATNLLAKGIPIQQTYQRLGYTNIESFNRMFKKHRGLTPTQYVKRFDDNFY
ncbi:AraC family transcriptional regulator [Vibrio kyushuensis]|uniref:AraC family transcriptional regulator n=1 Tax=Vibrio kyushuensis TaxID=2910249 RepID=UPI003D14C5C4